MNYFRVSFQKPEAEQVREIFVALLAELGFESFEETEQTLEAYIPETGFSEEAIKEIPFIKQHGLADKMKPVRIEDQNWNAVWESNYPPVLIDNQIYIYAPFHKPKPNIPFRIVIKPKMSFGTAHHETTALMMQLMLKEDFAGKTVLDMGSGTAVLSILASLKGAAHIDAIDNDKWAYNNALENLKLNSISNVKPVLGDAVLLKEAEKYDIILANINKNILLRDTIYYSDALKKGGSIFFSGFFESDLEDIKRNAQAVGLYYECYLVKNSWVVARFVKQ